MSARGGCCADTKLEASSDQKQAVSGSTRRSKLARSCEVTEIWYHSEGGSLHHDGKRMLSGPAEAQIRNPVVIGRQR